MLPDPMAAIFVHDFNYNATELAGSSPFCRTATLCIYDRYVRKLSNPNHLSNEC